MTQPATPVARCGATVDFYPGVAVDDAGVEEITRRSCGAAVEESQGTQGSFIFFCGALLLGAEVEEGAAAL